MTEADRPRVAAIILAAGASSRMGRPKLLFTHHGVPLVRRAVETAEGGGCTDVVVVLGANHEQYRPQLQGTPARLLHNPEFSQGMSSSIRVGIEALAQDTQAAIIMLADQPFIDRAVIERLITTYVTAKARIVACAYNGVHGAPVLFDRALFLELLLLEGDQGARHVLTIYPRHVTTIEISSTAAKDIDTPEDARRLLPDD
ncbi:MAG TPA: nucleotidyltransferase family protein [bacterium]|nr:nucleotidyltransferase family protein [bacterium]